jgi:hypothetical protein
MAIASAKTIGVMHLARLFENAPHQRQPAESGNGLSRSNVDVWYSHYLLLLAGPTTFD